jgi:hypothetical protein
MSSDLQTIRGRFFFWIGLAILPLFWIGWMTPRDFSYRQISGARLWTVAYTLILVACWNMFPALRSRVWDLQLTYSLIAFQIGTVLWIWLILRTSPVGQTIVGFMVCMPIIGMLSSLAIPALQAMSPHPVSLSFVILPAVLHLLVEPSRRLWDLLMKRRRD